MVPLCSDQPWSRLLATVRSQAIRQVNEEDLKANKPFLLFSPGFSPVLEGPDRQLERSPPRPHCCRESGGGGASAPSKLVSLGFSFALVGRLLLTPIWMSLHAEPTVEPSFGPGGEVERMKSRDTFLVVEASYRRSQQRCFQHM